MKKGDTVFIWVNWFLESILPTNTSFLFQKKKKSFIREAKEFLDVSSNTFKGFIQLMKLKTIIICNT
ncbi:hypothetical protein CARUB_v10022378mg [Capsella rubella]|uniref:Uncharacterized protein n=1 Tax=Capsella rubella TaxID=81985 RepID=R0GGG7_9BRAS|nr:hypothetical protein CARUB_v10022378mg [Capsella rubella]